MSTTRRARREMALERATQILRQLSGWGVSVYGGPELDPDDGQILVWLGASPTKWYRHALLGGWHPWGHLIESRVCAPESARFVGESGSWDGGECSLFVYRERQVAPDYTLTGWESDGGPLPNGCEFSSIAVAFRPEEGGMASGDDGCEPAHWSGLRDCE